MFRFLLFFTLLVVVSTVHHDTMLPATRTAIADGVTTGIVPYHVAVFQVNEDRYSFVICSGSIVSSRFVLTAAQCFHQTQQVFPIKIRAGSPNGEFGGCLHKATHIIRHSSYKKLAKNSLATVNDIALIKVNKPFKLGPNIAIIPLFQEETPAYIYGTASTWGRAEGLSASLKAVRVELWDKVECARYYESVPFPEGQICTGNPRQKSCHGNLGGPLVVNGTQVGIDIWGESVCWHGPLVYTEVAQYISWINYYIYEQLEMQD
ncbi:trypsin delta-like [Belonocnema kinseyi]|uniref:trypsin delta-like n=1 Tax=Belonocnema kinseyi TaxID=2817044 RepID=UPI00143CCAA0|nr:trypsin delta-like [Belonocnema kinseyi]